MTTVPENVTWPALIDRAKSMFPELFSKDGQLNNLVAGAWLTGRLELECISPVDGTRLLTLAALDRAQAEQAVVSASNEHASWSKLPLAERAARVQACLDELTALRPVLIACLTWEIGKTQSQAANDVDRMLDGVRWYLSQAESMLEARVALGLISNVASWNYPFSVLFHAMLVQALAGNSVIAKTPTKGGGLALALASALARRCGLPLSLVNGAGGTLGEVLVAHPMVQAVAFVGGRNSGRRVEELLRPSSKRYMLEMEGVNAYGVWDFSDWTTLREQLKKGFDFAKQRCTAYVRFVVQRRLLPDFLSTYLPIVSSIRVGNPLFTYGNNSNAPDIGPLIGREKAEELRAWKDEAVRFGAFPLFAGKLDDSLFVPEQDRSAYFAPSLLLNVPRSASLYYREPFGPLDSIVVVDTREELVAEINASGGALVASIASDDIHFARGVAAELRAFKVGINRIRSRGDRDEHFGGIGKSWRGCFVGGEHLVNAVTNGPEGAALYGNFEAAPQLAG
jgi:acyl-CoA reductase-like NAD-dependent aldehyde dehydrogenase